MILEQRNLTPQTVLLETDLWDSLAIVSVVALVDDLGGEIDGEKLAGAVTVGDILSLAGIGR